MMDGGAGGERRARLQIDIQANVFVCCEKWCGRDSHHHAGPQPPFFYLSSSFTTPPHHPGPPNALNQRKAIRFCNLIQPPLMLRPRARRLSISHGISPYPRQQVTTAAFCIWCWMRETSGINREQRPGARRPKGNPVLEHNV